MPKTAATTQSTLSQLSTTTNAGPTTPNLMSVTVTLTFDRVNFSPGGLYNALDAAYPTVSSEVDGAERRGGPYRFRISP